MKHTAIFSTNGRDVLRATIQTKIISGHLVAVIWEGDHSAILAALPTLPELPMEIAPPDFVTYLTHAATLAKVTVRFEKVGRAIHASE